MYIVVNRCFGGFGLNQDFCEKYEYGGNPDRTDTGFIKDLCEYGFNKASGNFAEIMVAEIPDDSTDYEINNYDGIESVIYVTDGKIRHNVKYIDNEQGVVI